MEKEKNVLTVPIAIVVAGIIIGGAIFITRGGEVKSVFQKPVEQAPVSNTTNISSRPVDLNDHILGNPNAPIIMVEYSDLECPFCKSFHKTMQTLLDEYGKDGKVAWVYRHFPLDIHPKAPKEAEATECAAEMGGNKAFWDYVNGIFAITPANNGLDPAKLPVIAGQIGLDVQAFQTCLDSGKYTEKVKADYSDGLKAGVNGTPNTVLVLNKTLSPAAEQKLGEINQNIMRQLPPGSSSVLTIDSGKRKVDIGGAFQYAMMKEILDLLLSEK
ncbi:MAG: Periplasmic thiol:disulfide interchange protein DsbA [Parcubacteria group bacterium GW2011_GWA2_47_16]|nr:MAG: Periplasmic thiol:disulfide interchange protein DsbA [Parcubacteria group bacterium GW2011_GWA2_47_16]